MSATDLLVELFIDGVWVDVTADVRTADGVSITRGRRDEGTDVDPGSLRLTLDQTELKYSNRTPGALYYRKLGRNTPIRVTVDGQVRAVMEVPSWPPPVGPARQ